MGNSGGQYYKIKTWEILGTILQDQHVENPGNNIKGSTRGKFWGTILQEQDVGNSGGLYYQIKTWEILEDNITRLTRGKF